MVISIELDFRDSLTIHLTNKSSCTHSKAHLQSFQARQSLCFMAIGRVACNGQPQKYTIKERHRIKVVWIHRLSTMGLPMSTESGSTELKQVGKVCLHTEGDAFEHGRPFFPLKSTMLSAFEWHMQL